MDRRSFLKIIGAGTVAGALNPLQLASCTNTKGSGGTRFRQLDPLDFDVAVGLVISHVDQNGVQVTHGRRLELAVLHNVQIAIQLSFLHFEYCVDKGSSLTHFFYLIVEIKFNNFTREFFILISNNLFLVIG